MKYVFLLMGILVGLFWSEIYREFSRFVNGSPQVSQARHAPVVQRAPKPDSKPVPVIPAQSTDDLKVFSDKRFGFLVKHPFNWVPKTGGGLFTRAEFTSQSQASSLAIRMHGYRGDEEDFMKGYKNSMLQQLKKPPESATRSFVDGNATHDLTLEIRQSDVRYSIHNRVIFFADERAVIALEGRCPVAMNGAECLMLDNIMRSFWVYNRDKLAEFNPEMKSRTFGFN